ncbi:MAG: hypothetical protein RI947_750 [Candidatus Parcubacteria bacterium]|jgi:uncharacterized membrane protein
MNKIERLTFFIIVLGFTIGFILYPQMPYWMVSHWDIEGHPDGFLHKFWGLFIIPLVSMLVFLVFQYLPQYDKNVALKDFRPYYDDFLLALTSFFFVLYLATIFWNIGIRFMIGSVISLAFAAFFYYLSIMLEHSHQNNFIGIRTPWTLKDKHVWEKTHLLAGTMYRAVATVAVVGAFMPRYALYFMLIPLLLSTIYLVVYSYAEYHSAHHAKNVKS